MAEDTAAPTISANCFCRNGQCRLVFVVVSHVRYKRETSNVKGFEGSALGSLTFHLSRLTFHGT